MEMRQIKTPCSSFFLHRLCYFLSLLFSKQFLNCCNPLNSFQSSEEVNYNFSFCQFGYCFCEGKHSQRFLFHHLHQLFLENVLEIALFHPLCFCDWPCHPFFMVRITFIVTFLAMRAQIDKYFQPILYCKEVNKN